MRGHREEIKKKKKKKPKTTPEKCINTVPGGKLWLRIGKKMK